MSGHTEKGAYGSQLKVRVFQSDVSGGNLTREMLLDIWKQRLSEYQQFDVTYYGRMNMNNIDEEVGERRQA